MILKKIFMTLTAGVIAISASQAESAYPDRPITMIVAYGAGGGTDVTARMLAPYIEKQLGGGATVVVVNRPGAGGEIGFAAIAEAAPDGYTIGFINTPNVISIPIERQARYSPDKLDPLVNIIDDPGVLTVHADSPFKTVADLVTHAKDNPSKVTVATTGVGSDDHLAMLLLQRQAKVKMTHVPFPGNAESFNALLGRHILAEAKNLGEGLRDRQGNPIRILGVMSTERWSMADDVPTFKEQGFDIASGAMRGIAAPKGLPADIRTRLVDAVTKAVEDPEFQAKAKDTFQPLRVLAPEAYAAELKRLDQQFRSLWQESPWFK